MANLICDFKHMTIPQIIVFLAVFMLSFAVAIYLLEIFFPKTIKIQEGLAPRMRPDHRLVDFTNADPNIHSTPLPKPPPKPTPKPPPKPTPKPPPKPPPKSPPKPPSPPQPHTCDDAKKGGKMPAGYDCVTLPPLSRPGDTSLGPTFREKNKYYICGPKLLTACTDPTVSFKDNPSWAPDGVYAGGAVLYAGPYMGTANSAKCPIGTAGKGGPGASWEAEKPAPAGSGGNLFCYPDPNADTTDVDSQSAFGIQRGGRGGYLQPANKIVDWNTKKVLYPNAQPWCPTTAEGGWGSSLPVPSHCSTACPDYCGDNGAAGSGKPECVTGPMTITEAIMERVGMGWQDHVGSIVNNIGGKCKPKS